MSNFDTGKASKGKESSETGKPQKEGGNKVRRNFYIDKDLDKRLRKLKVEFDAGDLMFEQRGYQETDHAQTGGTVPYSAIVEQALREYIDKRKDTKA